MLKEGDVFEIKIGDRVYTDVPRHFVYSNHKGDWSLTHHEISVADNFQHLAGDYVVYKAYSGGGSTGGGMNRHDDWPDGWHVFAKKASDPKIQIDFYQSGCFTAMIPNREAKGRAKLQWVIK